MALHRIGTDLNSKKIRNKVPPGQPERCGTYCPPQTSRQSTVMRFRVAPCQ